jgi:signal peptidase I
MAERSFLKAISAALRFLSIALVAMALSLSLLVIAQQVFNPFHVVISDSMSPQIETGDAVILSDLDPGEVKVGQVIIFRDPVQREQFIIHRVVNIEEDGTVRYFTTKGDNNPGPDETRVSPGEIVGGVAMNLPSFGFFLEFLSTARGYLSCIAIPGAVSLALVFLLSLSEKLVSRRSRRKAEYRPQVSSF